jgi:hypothetical protein
MRQNQRIALQRTQARSDSRDRKRASRTRSWSKRNANFTACPVVSFSGEWEVALSSIGKSNAAKVAGVPPWTEQMAEFGAGLWRNAPDHADELLAALVLLLAVGVLFAGL